jgi:hypothetical protein
MRVLQRQLAAILGLGLLEIRLCWYRFLCRSCSCLLCSIVSITDWVSECLVLFLFWRVLAVLAIFLIVAFVEEGEVVRILLFSILRGDACFFRDFVVLVLLEFLILWCSLMITHTFVADIANIIIVWTVVLPIAANIVNIFMS